MSIPSYPALADDVRQEHIDLDWTVDFDQQTVGGRATYRFKIVAKSIRHIVNNTLVDIRFIYSNAYVHIYV